MLLDEADKTVGVWAKEHGIRVVRGKSRVNKEVIAEAGDADRAPERAGRILLECTRLFEKTEQERFEIVSGERPVPAEDVAMRGSVTKLPSEDNRVGCRSSGGETVAIQSKKMEQFDKRGIAPHQSFRR